jgi:general stress protein YciG
MDDCGRIFSMEKRQAMKPKRQLTLTEFAALGGKARARKLTPEQRREIARRGGQASGRKRQQDKEGQR